VGIQARRNAESEIEYPVEALDKVMSAWTDRNALHKLCKGALMAMTELTEAELTDMTVSAPEAPIPPATEVAGFLGASSVNVEPMMNVPGKSVLSADQVRGMLEVMPGMALYWDDYGHVSVARNEEFERLPPGDQNRLLKQFIAALHLEAGLEV
jgi:hypothetical protein